MLEFFSVPITPLNGERRISVYLPENYHETNQAYPVLYMHDGQNVFRDDEAIGGLSLGLEDYLDEHHLKLIIVAIDQSQDRINEYCPWKVGEYSKKISNNHLDAGGKGKLYVEFIVEELKPLIDKKYRTLKNHSAMAGISLGGLITTYAACRYPEIFQSIAGQSSAFFRNQEEMEAFLKEADLSRIERVYLDCGTNEGGDDEAVNKEFVASNQIIYHLIKEKVPDTQFTVFEGDQHHYSDFRKRFPAVLSFLFPGLK